MLSTLSILIFILTACMQQETHAVKGATPAESNLLFGVPESENTQYQSDNPFQEGEMKGYYTSNAAPLDIIESYNSVLEAYGWTFDNFLIGVVSQNRLIRISNSFS